MLIQKKKTRKRPYIRSIGKKDRQIDNVKGIGIERESEKEEGYKERERKGEKQGKICQIKQNKYIILFL